MTESATSRRHQRRHVLALLLASAASPLLAGAPQRAPRPKARSNRARLQGAGSVEKIIEKAGLTGQTGFAVADVDTGEILESRLADTAFPPASVTKTVTTLYALDTLGAGYHFTTRVLGAGALKNGRLMGDLYLVGGGDPTLDTDALAALARELKAAGLREVSGKAYVYDGALPYQKAIDPHQPVYLGYNPSLSGLNLNYNRVFFEWKRQGKGYAVSMDARSRKFRPRVSTATMAVVDRRAPVFALNTSSRADNWTVARRALGAKGGRWLPVRRPAIYSAEVFRTLARSYGIVLPEFRKVGLLPAGTVLAERRSRPLADVLRVMLKYSTNLTAEAAGFTASVQRGAAPPTLRISGRRMSDWARARYGLRRARFNDHSGLEDTTRLTPSDMMRVLLGSGWNGPLRGLMKEIPMRDSKGNVVKKSRISIKAKTGTLNFVSALAGYVKTGSGRRLAFVIFSADMAHRSRLSRAEKERPRGAREWNRRAKHLQRKLIARWAATFSS